MDAAKPSAGEREPARGDAVERVERLQHGGAAELRRRRDGDEERDEDQGDGRARARHVLPQLQVPELHGR